MTSSYYQAPSLEHMASTKVRVVRKGLEKSGIEPQALRRTESQEAMTSNQNVRKNVGWEIIENVCIQFSLARSLSLSPSLPLSLSLSLSLPLSLQRTVYIHIYI